MDELEKLFAEAAESVKKVVKTSKQEPPAEAAPARPAPPAAGAPPAPASPAASPAPTPAPPARPTGTPVQVSGGQQTPGGLSLTSASGTIEVPWSGVRKVCLGRAENVQVLALNTNAGLLYFRDDNIAYRGLVSQLQPSATANWRAMVAEFADKAGKTQDPGVQAVTTGTGMIPKYPSLEALFAAARGD
jgi:hypothetical protein